MRTDAALWRPPKPHLAVLRAHISALHPSLGPHRLPAARAASIILAQAAGYRHQAPPAHNDGLARTLLGGTMLLERRILSSALQQHQPGTGVVGKCREGGNCLAKSAL